MVSAGEFKKGLTIEIDGQVWVIVDFQHVKPGKGAAFVRTKMKNVISGGVIEKSFSPTEKFPKALVERKDISTTTANFTTSWTQKHTISSPSTSKRLKKLSPT